MTSRTPGSHENSRLSKFRCDRAKGGIAARPPSGVAFLPPKALLLPFLVLGLWIQLFGPHGVSALADQEAFPFLGEVTGDHVNIRSGPSANFERLCRLDQGMEVIVVDKMYSWYKIQLPPSAASFVSKDYVQFLGQNAGGITADRVNIRAGAGIHHTVVGQLTKGEQIFIREELDKWYRIHPVAGSYGWVAERFLTFKSKDISEYRAMPSSAPSIEGEPAEADADRPVEEKEMGGGAGTESNGIFSAAGYVEPHEGEGADGISYKIVADGRPVCYIQGPNRMLGRFMHQLVTVDGTVNQKLQSRYAYPVIIVSKVRLML